MGKAANIGKYQLGKTIGEGTFAKVKVAVNMETRENVAIKIIDKQMVISNRLMDQVGYCSTANSASNHHQWQSQILIGKKLVKREISTMKLLDHPNIVRIYEVIATKTKIFIVMEYVSGGQLSDKFSYLKRLNESDARKYFQQLIDAVDYCHSRGVYHRDLKPENLLLDNKGNVKVSDFGLSILRKPGDLLLTACGSPSYVAPEVITNKAYDGSAADIWSCGVILFELLSGNLPFDERNLSSLYRKISKAEYTFPEWFTPSQRNIVSKLLNPFPRKRITVAEILEDEWFQIDYEPSIGIGQENLINLDHADATFDDNVGENTAKTDKTKSSNLINAFQLIAMSNDLDLSGLFEEEDNEKQKTKLGSKHSIHETIEKIQVAAKDARLSFQRMNSSKVKLHEARKLTRCRSHFTVSAEVTEVTPTHCVVEISKSAGELTIYKEFCESLSSLLKGKLDESSTELQNLSNYLKGGLDESSTELQNSSTAVGYDENEVHTTEQ